jgi:hypothetical protein
MKRTVSGLLGFLSIALLVQTADAWMRTGAYGTASGGGGSWNAHGYRGGSASGGGGSWSGTGYRGGTASGGGGSWNAHGAYGGSAYGSGGAWHATGAGGATASGYHAPGSYYGGVYHYGGSYYGAYHPPTVVNTYGTTCLNCGGWGAGAAAAGVLAGAAVGAAAANANAATANSNAYAAGVAAGEAQTQGAIYAKLPANCAFQPVSGVNYYNCNGLWLEPAFGANGVYYRSVAPP